MEWSHYSQQLFDTFTSTDSNIIVQACPGAGKTTNIKHLWSLDNKPTVYLVFNKHNQLEAQAKLPDKQGSSVLTLNGLGHRVIMNNVGKVLLDTNKVMNIIKNAIHYSSSKGKYEKQLMLNRAVQLAKMMLLPDSSTEADYNTMVSTYDVEEYPGMYHDVMTVLYISDSQCNVIDFADQLRLPVIHTMSMPHFVNVLGDEVQDFNSMQAQLVSMMQADRYVLVGDCHQSIYGFRGAMNDSMDYLRQQFDCVQLPLSISYRCPQIVVGEAQAIFKDIEAWQDAQPGNVYSTLDVMKEQFDKDTLVLCRVNRPLIALAFTLLKQGIACHVRGRDIGDGLVRLIKRQGASTVKQLLDSLEQWADQELYKARLKDDEHKVQSIQDKYDSLMVFCQQCSLHESPECVITAINKLFEQGKGVCLSTVHKAKGLEAQRCVLLEYKLFDLFTARCKQPWQAIQERNVKYVAVTRAQQTLVYG